MDVVDDSDMQLSADELLATYDSNCCPDAERVPFIGLNNLGNTCFFNSIVQVLFYCSEFRQQLFLVENSIRASLSREAEESQPAKDDTQSEAKCRLFLELSDLFTIMQSNQLSLVDGDCQASKDDLYSVRPEKLMTTLRKVYPAFEPYAQQDAQECLRCILSILQEALSFVRGKENKEKGLVKQSGCKVYGGRKLDGVTQASSSAERAQIENCDPNRSSVKQVSQSTTSRKRGVTSFLRKPLKLKPALDSQNSQPHKERLQICSPTKPTEIASNFKKSGTTAASHPSSQCENVVKASSKDSGCFAKLKRSKNGEKTDKTRPKVDVVASTPIKRPNPDDPPISPPLKRNKLSLSNGIRNFYKPLTSNLTKPRTLLMSDKKRSYAVLKSEKRRTAGNPFKVALKPDRSKYRPLSDKPVQAAPDFGSGDTQRAPNSPVLNSRKIAFNVPEKVVQKSDQTKKREISHVDISDFIEDMFQGQLVNEIRCMECENSLQRKEPFMDISLPVKEDGAKDATTECGNDVFQKHLTQKKTCSVGWGLSEFASRELLEGENKYYCEHCRGYVEGERRIQISSLPPILTLHLKRFTTSKPVAGGDAFCSTVSKINSSLNVPQHLCLSSWAAPSCNDRTSNYSLFGVVIHSGITISSGHYLSYVRLDEPSTNVAGNDGSPVSEQLSSFKGSWLEADDERTRILTQKELDTILSPPDAQGVARTPYLLFYRRECEAPVAKSRSSAHIVD